MPALILTGASGAGKTSIAAALAADGIEVFHFDSIGVPSPEAMTADWGSGEQWQAAMTRIWIEQLAQRGSGQPILLEGQMRIAFIHEALAAAPSLSAQILLIDCDDATRDRRLVHDRAQPELAHANMRNWAAFLRREATAAGIPIIDTSHCSVAQSAAIVRSALGQS